MIEKWSKDIFWKIKNYGLQVCRDVRLFPKRLLCRGGAGTMEQYFRVKYRYEAYGDGHLDKTAGIYKKEQKDGRDVIRKYGQLVTTASWTAEKQKEKEMLEEAIIHDKKRFSKEYEKETAYIRNRGELMLYPYPFTEKYLKKQDSIRVYTWKKGRSRLKYVKHFGKKLFFPEQPDEDIRYQYTQLVMEQDPLSPHVYFHENFMLEDGDIFVDVGSAEGMISLDAAEKAGEVYLIERSESWNLALKATFQKYHDKIHIIRAYAGLNNVSPEVTLDKVLTGYTGKRIFIKMDIEGMELQTLHGCLKTMKRNDCFFACASYHTNTVKDELMTFFKRNGYETEAGKGYMLFMHGHMTLENGMYERMKYPYFRTGIVRAFKAKGKQG